MNISRLTLCHRGFVPVCYANSHSVVIPFVDLQLQALHSLDTSSFHLIPIHHPFWPLIWEGSVVHYLPWHYICDCTLRHIVLVFHLCSLL